MKRILLPFLLAATLFSCKKKSSDDPKPVTPVDSTTAVIRDNVHVIDTAKSILNRDTALLNKGSYQFTGSASGNFAIGDILVGQAGNGYLRKVTGVTKSGSTTTYSTAQAAMTDVLENGQLAFDFNTSDFKTSNIKINETRLHPSSTSAVNFVKASASVSGSVSLDANFANNIVNYSNHTLHYANVGFNSASLTGSLKFKIDGEQHATIGGDDVLFHASSRPRVIFVGEVPVVVKANFELHAVYSIKVDQSISKEVNFTSTNTVSARIIYSGSQWSYPKDFSSSNNVVVTPFTGNASLDVDIAIVPEVSFVFYGVAGPYFKLGIEGNEKGTLNTQSTDWDFGASAWLQGTIGARASIWGVSKELGSITFSSNKIEYSTPANIVKTSGDSQTADVSKQLPQPIRVQVLDSRDKPQARVPVYFEVAKGGGKVDKDKVLTDNSGYAQTSWTLGELVDTQKVTAKVKRGDGSLIAGAPVTFAALPQIRIGSRAFGGVVFYIDESKKHGLVCAVEDQGTGVPWNNLNDNNVATTGAVGADIYEGASNTTKIVNAFGTGEYAAYLCKNYKGGGYADWYLPSKNELLELLKQIDNVKLSFGPVYWSSTELPPRFNQVRVFASYFDSPGLNSDNNDNMGWQVQPESVRAVRKF